MAQFKRMDGSGDSLENSSSSFPIKFIDLWWRGVDIFSLLTNF